MYHSKFVSAFRFSPNKSTTEHFSLRFFSAYQDESLLDYSLKKQVFAKLPNWYAERMFLPVNLLSKIKIISLFWRLKNTQKESNVFNASCPFQITNSL